MYLLRRFAPRYQREALIGDLLEEHARGRSAAWCWWQVICALGSSAQQAIHAHRTGLIVVAAWWSILLFLTLTLRLPLILFALDPSVYWWLRHRGQRRAAGRRALLVMMFVALCLPWGLPRPADAAQGAAMQPQTRVLHQLAPSAGRERQGHDRHAPQSPADPQRPR